METTTPPRPALVAPRAEEEQQPQTGGEGGALVSADDHAPIAYDPATAQMVAALPMSLRIFFDPNLWERCKDITRYLAKAEGFTPRHLIGKQEACFAVVSRSLAWRLDPYAVASATFQTPDGKVGYSGALCRAILENSGHIQGAIKFEYYGDWSKVQRKFKMATSTKGNEYPVPTYTAADEQGLGIKVSALLKGETEPRILEFDLVQAYPRFATTWATDPKTQIGYAAVRRFGSAVVPSLFFGVAFDGEAEEDNRAMVDVTPPPLVDAPGVTAAERAQSEAARRPRGRPPGKATAPPASTAPEPGNPAPASPPPPPAAPSPEPQPEQQRQPARVSFD
jgi:hypothetical protein